MKRTDTVALYRDAFLEGKSEEARRKFDEKGIDKQYGSIMAWKRRQTEASNLKSEITINTIVNQIKQAKKDLSKLGNLSAGDMGRIIEAIDLLREDIDNFDRIKKSQLLRELESEREKINRQGEDINRQIEELRQQLS